MNLTIQFDSYDHDDQEKVSLQIWRDLDFEIQIPESK